MYLIIMRIIMRIWEFHENWAYIIFTLYFLCPTLSTVIQLHDLLFNYYCYAHTSIYLNYLFEKETEAKVIKIMICGQWCYLVVWCLASIVKDLDLILRTERK